MIPALTIHDIEEYCGQHYDPDERRIVGIMIARYNIPQSEDMIKQQYDFWHKLSGGYYDNYWLGYGAYFFPGEHGQYLLGNYGNEYSVYFDLNVFVSEVQKLEQYQKIRDEIGIILCNFHHGKIHLDESVFFNLEQLMSGDNRRLREFVNYLLELCIREYDVANVTFKLKAKYHFLRDIPSKIIQATMGIIGAVSSYK